jgi:methylmalonyl-CoA/ethylmalonyl-CoA epimerase
MPPTRIHHINFVVRDLEEAMTRFEQALGVAPFEVIEHRPRGAQVARTRIGQSWIVLVSPYDPESVPGRHLARHGEGFFLLSIGYDDIVKQLERLEASGVPFSTGALPILARFTASICSLPTTTTRAEIRGQQNCRLQLWFCGIGTLQCRG